MAWRTANGMLVGPGMKRPWKPDILFSLCGSIGTLRWSSAGHARAGPAAAPSGFGVDRKACAQLDGARLDVGLRARVAGLALGRQAVQHLGDHPSELAELGDAETARGAGGRAEPQARGDRGL